MDCIRFVLNERAVTVTGVSPTLTLLRWLRDHAGLVGTKEGCAEGDCGACTVVLADPVSADGLPTWRAVNACLVLLPSLHGRTVWTVEGLAREGGLHPAQQALVRELGSQCGYCTPGVVMSLFEATYRRDLSPRSDAAIEDQLCGNLCRCTGYRPIRDAAVCVAGKCPEDEFATSLDAADGASPIAFVQATRRFFAPASLAELFDVLDANPDHRLVAGATDLALEVTKRHAELPCLVSLEAIPELRQVTTGDGSTRLGATVVLADLEALSGKWPPLRRMLRFFASRQIKNRATLGGNLCNASPIGDCAPVLLALGAVIVARGRNGERRIPIDEFFVGYRKTALNPGEILAAVEVPDLPLDALASAYKVSKRRELDISAVAAGMLVRVDQGVVVEARLGFGGMAATPKRARAAEAALVGRPWDEESVGHAILALGDDFEPMSDHRGSAWFRATVARNLLLGFFHETVAERLPALESRPSGTVRPEVS